MSLSVQKVATGTFVNLLAHSALQLPLAIRVRKTRVSFRLFDLPILYIVLSGSVALIAYRDQVNQSGSAILIAGLAVTAIGVTLVILHGQVRLLAYRWCHVPVYGMAIDYAGDDPDVARERSSPAIETCVGLVGIAASLIHAAAILAIHALWAVEQDSPLLEASTMTLTLYMLALALLQFMPGISQDGGQIVRGTIWHFSGSPMRGAWITGRIGQATGAVVILILGIAFLISFNLVIAVVLLAAHLAMLARHGAHDVGWQYANVDPEIELRDLIERPARLIPSDDTIGERIAMLQHDRSAAYLVIDPNGTTTGIIGASNLNPITARLRRNAKVAEIMTPIDRVRTLPEAGSAATAWETVRRHGDTAIVISNLGEVTDIVTHHQLRSRLVILSHRNAAISPATAASSF